MLSHKMLADRDKIQDQLQQPMLIIENALDLERAELLYKALSEFKAWKTQDTQTWIDQGIDVADFAYQRKHINISDEHAPIVVRELHAYLNSIEMRQWFSMVSGRQCDKFIASATMFNNGDHISEHNDYHIYQEPDGSRYVRALTFNYYLSKNWDTAWGGNFIWKEPYQKIGPTFNSLVLFNVTNNSHHWVEPVHKEPGEKRLSITGWFLTEIRKQRFSLSI